MARKVVTIPLALALAILASCGGSGTGGAYGTGPTTPPGNTSPPNNPGSSNPNVVTVSTSSFTPASLSVAVGTTVTWNWAQCVPDPYYGTECTSHNVTFDDGKASETQSAGQFSRAFDTPGTYRYHCTIHGAAVMSGEVIVQ